MHNTVARVNEMPAVRHFNFRPTCYARQKYHNPAAQSSLQYLLLGVGVFLGVLDLMQLIACSLERVFADREHCNCFLVLTHSAKQVHCSTCEPHAQKVGYLEPFALHCSSASRRTGFWGGVIVTGFVIHQRYKTTTSASLRTPQYTCRASSGSEPRKHHPNET